MYNSRSYINVRCCWCCLKILGLIRYILSLPFFPSKLLPGLSGEPVGKFQWSSKFHCVHVSCWAIFFFLSPELLSGKKMIVFCWIVPGAEFTNTKIIIFPEVDNFWLNLIVARNRGNANYWTHHKFCLIFILLFSFGDKYGSGISMATLNAILKVL